MSNPGDYGCCDTLNHLTAEPRLAGHHALCPRFGLAALARRIAEDDGASYGERAKRCYQTIEDRAVLVQGLREERAARATERAEWQEAERVQVDEVARLRGIVEALAESDTGEVCVLCSHLPEWPAQLGSHAPACPKERARASLGPAGTLASLPVDDCDGDDR